MRNNTRKPQNSAAKAPVQPARGLYDAMNGFLERNQQRCFIIALILSALMCLLLFDVKVSKSAVWPGSGEAYSVTSLLAKDSYNLNRGMEDFPGLVRRFVVNSHVYFLSFLPQFMGLIAERSSSHIDIVSVRTIAMYVWYTVCLAVLFKRNRTLLFVGLYVGVMCFATFALVNIVWSQERFILIYYPFIPVFLLGGSCYLLNIYARKFFFLYPVFLLAISFGTLSITVHRIGRNLPVLQQNLLGDPLYGLTPDWQNFKCKNANNMRVYDPELLLNRLINQKVDYILLPRLRFDPTQKTGRHINDIHLAVQCMSFKYPHIFQTIHTIGNDELCEIVKLIK